MTKRNTPNKKRAQNKPMEFSDGIDHLAAESKEARSLEDLLGFKETNPFGVSSAEEFDSTIEELQLTNLQELAVKAGVFPSGTKATLKAKLRKSFNQYTHGGARKVVQITKPLADPDSKEGKALLKIMQEGF
jgi:hypothetical protein